MTGKYAHTSGGIGLSHMGWPLGQEQRTVTDIFNDAGVETAHFGLNHERHAGNNRYKIDEERDWSDWHVNLAVDKSIEYLKSRSLKGMRFYLNIGVNTTHKSCYAANQAAHIGGMLPPEETHVPNFLPDDPNFRREFGMFGAGVKYLDKHIGRLFDAIQQLGYFENSLVIFTTDHGIWAPRSKGTLYDRGVETALLMRVPKKTGIEPGTAINFLIQNIDLAPTVLDAMGISVPSDMQGRSFWPVLCGEDYRPHEAIFTERNFHGERLKHDKNPRSFYDPIRAVRTNKFHYIRWMKPEAAGRSQMPWELAGKTGDPFKGGALWPFSDLPRKSEELYDVEQDPLEFVDLSERPEYAKIKAGLSSRLDEWMRTTGDFALTDNVPREREIPSWGDNFPRKDNDFRFVP
jgi:arylsulfatase A-like enzyme